MTAGPVRKTETEPGQCHARNCGWKPLPEHVSAPHGAVRIDDWELFVVHEIQVYRLPEQIQDSRSKILDAVSS